MYANFYNGERLLFSVKVNSEKQAESLFENEYYYNTNINDYTITNEPLSQKILR
jgi:hypothetical protein